MSFCYNKKAESRQHYIFFENIMLIWWGLETPTQVAWASSKTKFYDQPNKLFTRHLRFKSAT